MFSKLAPQVRHAVACTLAACAVAPAPAQAADPSATLGTYRGASAVSSVQQWESWRGAPAAQALDFLADEDWSKIATPYWWVGNWSASTYKTRMVYSVPMLPQTSSSLAEGATGAYDSYFRSLAQMLVENGQGAVTIRLGWEFNGNWYRWRVDTGGEANYAAYYRRVVTAMRSVAGATFKFDWCTNNGSVPATVNPELAYPGDAYVDFVSQDVYDQYWPATTDEAARWKGIVERPYGLNWLAGFAAAHGKRIGLPEWGIGYGNPTVGGDSPAFIQHMYDWIAQHDVAYSNYWEYEGAQLMTGANPLAAARFKALFRPPTNTTPAPAPTADPGNLAIGRTTSSSSDAGPEYAARYAADGSPSTRWSSGRTKASTQWWSVDLGSQRTVSRVVVNWAADYAPSYLIQTSSDGLTWDTARNVSISGAREESSSFTSRAARYVRVLASTRGLHNVSFWEAQVY